MDGEKNNGDERKIACGGERERDGVRVNRETRLVEEYTPRQKCAYGRDRQTDRQRQRQRDRDTERDRDRYRQRKRHRERESQRQRDRQRDTERQRQRDGVRTDRQTGRVMHRDRSVHVRIGIITLECSPALK